MATPKDQNNKSFPERPLGALSRTQTTRRPLSGEALNPDTLTEKIMDGPVTGVITNVYLANDMNNYSNGISNQLPATSEQYELGRTGRRHVTSTRTNTKGYQVEVDVKIILPVTLSGTIIPKAVFAIPFGGVENYSYVLPRATTNSGERGYTGKENGDHCLVQFIGGRWENPVVTHILPHPLNKKDNPRMEEDHEAFCRINGTTVLVDPSGNLQINGLNAGEERITDSNSGITKVKQSRGAEGEISVITRSDIHLVAGAARENELQQDLPLGNATMVASKDVVVLSQNQSASLGAQQSVNILSKGHEVYVNSEADGTLVKIQNKRGSLRRAARQYDKVRITLGSEGDLFTYLEGLHFKLQEIANNLLASQDPGALAAGGTLKAFSVCYFPPKFQEGHIITGSKYCKIASVGDASDIGGDMSGVYMVDSAGDPITDEELKNTKAKELLKECILEESEALIDDYKKQADQSEKRSELPNKLHQLADLMKLYMPTYAAAVSLQKLIPQIQKLLARVESGNVILGAGGVITMPTSANDLSKEDEITLNDLVVETQTEFPDVVKNTNYPVPYVQGNSPHPSITYTQLTGVNTEGDVAEGVDALGNAPGSVGYVFTPIKSLTEAVDIATTTLKALNDMLIVTGDGDSVAPLPKFREGFETLWNPTPGVPYVSPIGTKTFPGGLSLPVLLAEANIDTAPEEIMEARAVARLDMQTKSALLQKIFEGFDDSFMEQEYGAVDPEEARNNAAAEALVIVSAEMGALPTDADYSEILATAQPVTSILGENNVLAAANACVDEKLTP